MHFCLRDDDIRFFTSPQALEHAYGHAGGPTVGAHLQRLIGCTRANAWVAGRSVDGMVAASDRGV